jgi:hypothetical protein
MKGGLNSIKGFMASNKLWILSPFRGGRISKEKSVLF